MKKEKALAASKGSLCRQNPTVFSGDFPCLWPYLIAIDINGSHSFDFNGLWIMDFGSNRAWAVFRNSHTFFI